MQMQELAIACVNTTHDAVHNAKYVSMCVCLLVGKSVSKLQHATRIAREDAVLLQIRFNMQASATRQMTLLECCL